jgi:hypothetical protein
LRRREKQKALRSVRATVQRATLPAAAAPADQFAIVADRGGVSQPGGQIRWFGQDKEHGRKPAGPAGRRIPLVPVAVGTATEDARQHTAHSAAAHAGLLGQFGQPSRRGVEHAAGVILMICEQGGFNLLLAAGWAARWAATARPLWRWRWGVAPLRRAPERAQVIIGCIGCRQRCTRAKAKFLWRVVVVG